MGLTEKHVFGRAPQVHKPNKKCTEKEPEGTKKQKHHNSLSPGSALTCTNKHRRKISKGIRIVRMSTFLQEALRSIIYHHHPQDGSKLNKYDEFGSCWQL